MKQCRSLIEVTISFGPQRITKDQEISLPDDVAEQLKALGVVEVLDPVAEDEVRETQSDEDVHQQAKRSRAPREKGRAK